MNLDFLSPAYLWGILGVGVPMAIHLLTRRRQIRVKFSALYLLQEARKRSLKKAKPNRLLLLLARCLALAFFSLALANPIFSLGSNKELMFSSPSAVVFILDDSYSMNSRTEKATLYDDAVGKISAIIRKMPAHSEFALVTAVAPITIRQNWTTDPEAIPNLLKTSQTTYGIADIGKALQRASEMLDSSSQKIKVVYIMTDRAKNSWNEDSRLATIKGNPSYSVKIIDFSRLHKGENRAAVKSIEVSREFLANSRSLRIKASVINLLDNKRIDHLPITLWANGKKQGEGSLELQPKGTAVKEFLIPYSGNEPLSGYVEIEDDALPTDNRRYFEYLHDRAINVLVVDGDPRAVANQSESFYLERALNPFVSNLSDINPTISTLNELPENNLFQFPVVILANVRNLPVNYEIELEKYVMSGGALFVMLGDQIDVKYYNEKLGNLLPVTIETQLEATLEDDAFHLELHTSDHPAFKVFSAKNLQEMGNIRFSALYTVVSREDKKFTIPMHFKNNIPAMIETSVGKGKVILYTSSIDRDWNDFPIQPTFLPWIQRWVKYISRGLDSQSGQELLIGENYIREETGAGIFVQTPAGKIARLTKTANTNALRFEDTHYPGAYAIYQSQSTRDNEPVPALPLDAERVGGFTVNIDIRESDPETITEKAIQDYLAGIHVEVQDPKIIEEATPTGNSVQLATPLLLLMAFMFLCEGWMVRRE